MSPRTLVLCFALSLPLLAGCANLPEDRPASGTAAGAAAAAADGSGTVGAPAGTIGASELAAQQAGAPKPGTQEDFELNVGDRVFFAFDSAALDEAARAVLDRQAEWLLRYPHVTVTVEGHTDERGTREYNLALGERRAQAVKDYLAARGVSPDRILTISYGEERPVDPGHNEAAWALNRRAVTVINVTH